MRSDTDIAIGSLVNVETIISDLNGVFRLRVDPEGEKLYWGEWHRVQRASLDGSNVETFAAVAPDFGPSGIGMDHTNGRVYWVNASANGVTSIVERANRDGSGREQVFTIDGIYYIDIGPDQPLRIEPRNWGEIKSLYR